MTSLSSSLSITIGSNGDPVAALEEPATLLELEELALPLGFQGSLRLFGPARPASSSELSPMVNSNGLLPASSRIADGPKKQSDESLH